MTNIKIMVVFGTRPEAIKMCPLVLELNKAEGIETVVCVTGQHREMLASVLQVFNVVPDYDLRVMRNNQTLFDVTTYVLNGIREVLEKESPDLVLVHGDTSTTFSAALACFYMHIPVGHVEAGLRTYNLNAPFPEEFNRQVVSRIAQYHFAPTELSKYNLIKENIPRSNIVVTGNTAIDALKYTVSVDYNHELLSWVGESRLILLTAHRRENLGAPIRNIFQAVRYLTDEYEDVKVVYPVHPNPAVRSIAEEILGNCNRIRLTEPFDVIDFHNIMKKSYIILTDSGGIQEEAPSLGKPVLVLRETTERPEGVEAGTLKLVGTNQEKIISHCESLLNDNLEYKRMSEIKNPYGDGNASARIVHFLQETYNIRRGTYE